MIPDAAAIHHRRHLVVSLLRASAVALLGVSVILLSKHFAQGFVRGWLNATSTLWGLVENGAYGVLGLALALLSRPIAGWIVPIDAGLRMNLCPQCGYDTRGRRSPVCPECGLDLSPAGPSRSGP